MGGVCIKVIHAKQDDFLGTLRTHQPGQQHNHNPCPKTKLRFAEERIFTGDRHVTRHRQLKRARQCRAMNSRYGGFIQIPELHARLKVLFQHRAPRLPTRWPRTRLGLEVKAA